MNYQVVTHNSGLILLTTNFRPKKNTFRIIDFSTLNLTRRPDKLHWHMCTYRQVDAVQLAKSRNSVSILTYQLDLSFTPFLLTGFILLISWPECRTSWPQVSWSSLVISFHTFELSKNGKYIMRKEMTFDLKR